MSVRMYNPPTTPPKLNLQIPTLFIGPSLIVQPPATVLWLPAHDGVF